MVAILRSCLSGFILSALKCLFIGYQQHPHVTYSIITAGLNSAQLESPRSAISRTIELVIGFHLPAPLDTNS